MNNVLMRKIVVTPAYQPLVAQPLIVTVEISALPSNAAPVFFRGDDGSDVPWIAGEYHTLKSIDLAGLQIKGTPGDAITIIGGTW